MIQSPTNGIWTARSRSHSLGAGNPIVLCAVDWIGIANERHDAFARRWRGERGRRQTGGGVAVTLHQHDAPDCDFFGRNHPAPSWSAAPASLKETFQRQVISKFGSSKRAAAAGAGGDDYPPSGSFGQSPVEKVASNRRVMGLDRKSSRSALHGLVPIPNCDRSEGTIDPSSR